MKNKIIYGLGMFVLVMLSSVSFVSANGDDGGCWGMGGMMMGSYGFGGMFFGWVFSVLVIVALILLIAWLVKQIQK